MRKHQSFRAALVDVFPNLATDADKLAVFVEKGRIAARHGPELGFEYRYRLITILTDFAGDTNAVMLATLLWIRQHQPELLLNHTTGAEAITFDAVILDDKTVDLEIAFDVSEGLTATPRPGGGFALGYQPEPPIEDTFGGVPLGTLVGEIYLGDALICSAPAP